jgi:putative transposase
VLEQHRSTQRHVPKGRADEGRLVADMIELARQFGRYGYRRIAVLLREAGWSVSDGRIERLWRQEGLKVPQNQSKKGRLWLNDGSCVQPRPEYRHHVWSYDFVHCRTDDGKVFRTLNIIDEFSRECLAIKVDRKLNSINAIDALTDLFILRGAPAFIHSDNGPEFIVQAVRDWIAAVGTKTAYIEPGSPWETDTMRASMAGSETNCSTERSSTVYGTCKSSSKNGGDTTIRRDHTVHWAIAHRHLKLSYPRIRGQ